MTTGPDNLLEWKPSSLKVHQTLHEWRPLSIVSVGNDRKLLELREQLIIERTGLPVQSVTPEEAEELAHSLDSQVWVFCSTVEFGPLIYLASARRRYSPSSRLVLLQGPWLLGSEAALFHRILSSDRSVDLVETLRELTMVGGVKKHSASERSRELVGWQSASSGFGVS